MFMLYVTSELVAHPLYFGKSTPRTRSRIHMMSLVFIQQILTKYLHFLFIIHIICITTSTYKCNVWTNCIICWNNKVKSIFITFWMNLWFECFHLSGNWSRTRYSRATNSSQVKKWQKYKWGKYQIPCANASKQFYLMMPLSFKGRRRSIQLIIMG